MQRWLCIVCLLVAQSCMCHGANATDEVREASHVTSDLTKVRFIGRWYDVPGGKAHSWWAAFQIRFRGSSSVAAKLWSGLGLYFVCQVDDEAAVHKLHQDGDFLIATGLDASREHVVACGRSNEGSFGETYFKGVVLASGGELLQAAGPRESELRVEVIGDSITAGYATKWQPGQATGATLENSDVYDSYARYLADALATSEWQVVAKSGIPVVQYAPSEKPMADQWVCRAFTWAPSSCPREWEFSWHADVVVINLGTNDYVYGGSMTDQQFVEGYKALIFLVRQKYPDAVIMCLIPLAYSCFSQADSKWVRMKQDLEAAVQQINNDKVKLYATGSPASPWLRCLGANSDYSDSIHPTTAGNMKFASQLSQVLVPEIRRLYPSKCGGTGSHCEGGAVLPIPEPVAPGPSPAPQTTTVAPASSASGGSQCCYGGGCELAGSASCNPVGSWCSATASQCSSCGGTFCQGTAAATSTQAPTSAATTTTTTAATTTVSTVASTATPAAPAASPAPTPSTSSRCCYSGACVDGGAAVCNEPDAWCSASSENCQTCGGSLCQAASQSPSPSPATPTVRCSPIGDCSAAGWCDQAAYRAWCESHMDACPEPFCKEGAPVFLQTMHHLPASTRRKNKNTARFLGAVLMQSNATIARSSTRATMPSVEL
eukprot:TRINITY_DN2362_c0_g1_i1.p1 TRINITY_DN2362_c0_g1~~TRINITY_DN2362_c0_g1_i1.p1  ORF type:complete len:660 (-),score=89.91 TRINITY_DN2362_c0_g1_i1:171-2150(-)